jgi:hypothetical protein
MAAVRWSIRAHGGEPSSRHVDELLDERLSHCGRLGEDAAVVAAARTPLRRIQAVGQFEDAGDGSPIV